MRFDPPTVSPTESMFNLFDLFVNQNVGAIISVEDGKPLGIVTEKDILERVLKPMKDIHKTLVKDIMSTPLITIESDRSIKEALDLLDRHNIRRLPVTKNGILIGITTERRLLETAHDIFVYRSRELESGISKTEIEKPNITFLSSYPPRECGIATYTYDLVGSIDRLQTVGPPIITAINDKGGYYEYPSSVKLQIEREKIDTYSDTAETINRSDIDAVNLQHEFGLFGGVWGDYLVEFLEKLEKPVVTTLHTVLQNPPHEAEKVTKEILSFSDYVVVMARVGIKILEQQYDTFANNVRYIPHGCPNVPFVQSGTQKRMFNLEDRILLSTFGLISRGKGIEYAIHALPELVESRPNILYLIIGETHPEVRKHEGEAYRQSLFELIEELGLEENVRFVNRFLEKDELIRFLQATDVYILPYPNKEQISSGTLLYALCTGKAIVSTPFLHAEEIISQGAVVGCEFKDPGSIADSVKNLLTYDDIRGNLEKRAYEYSREMIWPNIAMRYVNLFYETLGL
jgi:glycosyltransferase involved in cell wall biosynthesis/predicted transcriptional regulator